MKFHFPKVLAWELTRRCPLKCSHCRASASLDAAQQELDTSECLKVIDSLVSGGAPPMIIWTGGEPMLRDDLVDIVRYASSKGVLSVLAPCGTLVTRERLLELKEAGIKACSFSVDGPDRGTHDRFRGIEGAWDSVFSAMEIARGIGMPFQMNTVVRKETVNSLDEIYNMAIDEGATRLDLFFLVMTGRASGLDDQKLDDSQMRSVIRWAEGKRVKLTCCPAAGTCIGGRGFAFLSCSGQLRTCGFFPPSCGNVRDFGFDFRAAAAAAVNPLGVNGDCWSVSAGATDAER